jgi:hypothetical protein
VANGIVFGSEREGDVIFGSVGAISDSESDGYILTSVSILSSWCVENPHGGNDYLPSLSLPIGYCECHPVIG